MNARGEVMAGPAPKTKSWSALENAHKPKGLHVVVSGAVEVANTRQQPRLAEIALRDPRVLFLALTIEDTSEPSLEVQCWKEAYFHKEVKANQYDSVDIRWDLSAIARFPVVDDREHTAHMAKLVQAANAAHPAKKPATTAKTAKKVAKKAAKKAAKVVSRAVRAVGGWAKGAKKALKTLTKKAPKKVSKKAPKKVAKTAARKAVKKASKPVKKTARTVARKAKPARRSKKR